MVRMVTSKADILKNVHSLEWLGKGSEANEKKLYSRLIKNGKVFIATRSGGRWLFAPSRFAGYINNGVDHDKISIRDGRETNRHITKLIGDYFDKADNRYSAIDMEFLAYCRRRGITPSKSHLPRRYWLIGPAPKASGAAGVGDVRSKSKDIASNLEDLLKRTDITSTKKKTLIDARLGHGAFRRKLVAYWKCCAFTGCDLKAVLRASHIMPWSQATDKQRVDASNGLLLEATIDALFDRFLITFLDDGSIKVSEELASYEGIFPLAGRLRKRLRASQKKYLKFHRKEFNKRQRGRKSGVFAPHRDSPPPFKNEHGFQRGATGGRVVDAALRSRRT